MSLRLPPIVATRPTMRLSLTFVVLVGLAVNLTACQGTPLVGGQADAAAARVPLNHRASGATCPAGRGPGSTSATSCPADGGTSAGVAIVGQMLCSVDGDCTAGTNGRCFLQGGPVTDCGTVCSYDACGSDSDCPGDEPCQCRTSASDAQANSCLTGGNCRLDSDCGRGGYCSPSQVDSFCLCPSPALCTPDSGGACYAGNQQVSCACGDSCGHSYYCHTKKDTCLDDSDCGSGQTCNYDTVYGIWDCATCWPVP
jgi:hypothetical protein